MAQSRSGKSDRPRRRAITTKTQQIFEERIIKRKTLYPQYQRPLDILIA